MQIQNINNTNFRGGFWIHNAGPVRAELDTFVHRGKQIFDNFQKEGDVFVLTRDELNKRLYKVLKDRVKFEFYPEMNTKLGLDCEEPQSLAKILPQFKVGVFPVENQSEMSIKQIAHSPRLFCKNIVRALKLDENSMEIIQPKNPYRVKIDSMNKLLTITKADNNFIHYVIADNIRSTSSSEPLKRYAIKSDGSEVKEFEGYSKEFSKLFNANIFHK